jgi:hypothetical protein
MLLGLAPRQWNGIFNVLMKNTFQPRKANFEKLGKN